MIPQFNLEEAKRRDEADKLSHFRKQFHIPKRADGTDVIYLCGNSLGLQPVSARKAIEQELDDWAHLAVEGHFQARSPWLSYHETLTRQAAHLVGAHPLEVVIMNTLTVNLHLMMVSFFRPSGKRTKILIEGGAFPSDIYAVKSQLHFHNLNADDHLIEMHPREGERTLRMEDIANTIEKFGNEIALVLFGGVQYLTGQAFDMKEITRLSKAKGATVGFDLAHAAGNIPLALHDWGVDFAVWCSYKYLNGGPGTLAGCFVHEKHAREKDLPRFAGWWGHDKASRFQMPSDFSPIPGAEGWQLSNPPIFQMAALRASLDIFEAAGMENLRNKSRALTGYMEHRLAETLKDDRATLITPQEENSRGAQLSIRIKGNSGETQRLLLKEGVVCDAREPDVVRVAPTPLYNSFEDVELFVAALSRILNKGV